MMATIKVNNQKEFSEKIAKFEMMGFKTSSMVDDIAILKKKNYNFILFLLLILIWIIPGLLYYLLSSTDEVMIIVENSSTNIPSKDIVQNAPVDNNKTCGSCGAVVDDDAEFCSKCGEKFVEELAAAESSTETCASCGAVVDEDDAVFCPSCGEKI